MPRDAMVKTVEIYTNGAYITGFCFLDKENKVIFKIG